MWGRKVFLFTRFLKFGLLIGVLAILVLPLTSSNARDWRIDDGLALLGIIFFCYALLSITSLAFYKNEKGYRIGGLDLILIGAFPLYLLYVGNERFLNSLDTLPSRYLPHAIVQSGSMDLSVMRAIRPRRLPYSIVRIDGKLLPSFPVGTGIVAVPYVAAARTTLDPNAMEMFILKTEKQFAALLSVASVLVFFAGIRKIFSERIAALAAAVYAIATTLFSSPSQAMWSFTGELFFLTVALVILMDAKASTSKIAFAGIAMGVAFLCRPTAIIILSVLTLVVYFQNSKKAWIFAISGGVSVAVCAGFLLTVYGHPLGAYGVLNREATLWRADFWNALAGNLFSPSRGVFIFFPYIAIAIYYALRTRDLFIRRWMIGSIVCVLLILCLTSLYTKWWGGHSLGPRLNTESAPFFALLTVPVWLRWSTLRWKRIVFVALLFFSIATQFQCVYDPSVSKWNGTVQVDTHPEVLWSWKNSQLAAAWVSGWEYQP
jgi:hypothetical protein